MKHLPIFVLALCIMSCKKPNREVVYAVTCDHCSAGYEDLSGAYRYIKLAPDTTYLYTDIDTVIDGVEMLWTRVDTTINTGPFTWQTRFMAPVEVRESRLVFAVSRLSTHGSATASRTIDGAKDERVLSGADMWTEFH